MTATSSRDATKERARFMQSALISVAEWAREAKADDALLEQMLEPYRQMLEEIYEHELPLARLIDESDLLLHVQGPAASFHTPRVSLVTRLLEQTRIEVTRLAKQIDGVIAPRGAASLDMGLVGFASGSLFVGFSATDPGGASGATKNAVDMIGRVGALVAEDAKADRIASTVEDPAERDMAINAVKRLAPTGQLRVDEVTVYGRAIPHSFGLTVQSRRHARRLMSEPASKTLEKATLVGTVREIDLDAKRLEIRDVEGRSDNVRCAHELEEETVRELIGKRVRVSGLAELGRDRRLRMLWVEDFEQLD